MKNLLILGASSDVGLAYLKEYGAEFDRIAAHYNSSDSALRVSCAEFEDRVLYIKSDFSDEADTLRFIADVKAEGFEPTHILHLSAKQCTFTNFAKSDWSLYQKEFDISVRSAFLVLRAFLPKMAKAHFGRVVIMLTAYTLGKPPKFLSGYVSQKYALLGLVKALAAEYADKSVTVNGISPELMETKYVSGLPRLIVQQNAAENPLGRNLSANDVTGTIEFLLSEAAACITGENVGITCGK